MKNEKKQTAVEWLFSETLGITLQLANKRISHRNWELQMVKLYEQAKEMEKEQISKAFDDGDYNYHYSRKTGDDFENGKEYFNELYK